MSLTDILTRMLRHLPDPEPQPAPDPAPGLVLPTPPAAGHARLHGDPELIRLAVLTEKLNDPWAAAAHLFGTERRP